MTDPLTSVFAFELSAEHARIAELKYQSQVLYERYMAGEIERDEVVRLDAHISRELEILAVQKQTIPFC